MTIYGLESVLKRNAKNFEPVRLRDTRVVVWGMDFCGAIFDQTSTVDHTYGGEYLSYQLELERILSCWKQWQISPYFVFHESSLFEGEYRLSRLTKTAQSLGDPPRNGNIFPHCLKSATIEALRKNNHSFLILSNPLLRDAAALADYWRCPLIATTSDFYVLASSNSLKEKSVAGTAHPYVSLHMCSVKPSYNEALDSTSHSGFLVKTFNAERSELKALCVSYRILAGVLMRCDAMPDCSLPQEIGSVKESGTPFSKYIIGQRWKAIVNWLASFSSDSDGPIKQIIEANGGRVARDFLQNLFQSISGFIFHPDIVGKRLAEIFENGNVELAEEQHNSLSIYQVQSEKVEPEDIVALLRGDNSFQLGTKDFTTDWPTRLTQAYRSYEVASEYVAPLYASGIILADSKESRVFEFSVYEPSLPLRLMHYRILVGLEHQLGNDKAKLVGLRPHAVEYVRRGEHLVSYLIPVCPLSIDCEQDSVNSTLSLLLGTDVTTSPSEPKSAFALAVTVAFWHRHCQTEKKPDNLECCSVALAVFACAAAMMTESTIDDRLVKHYQTLMLFLSKEGTNLDSSGTVCCEIIHHLCAIHILYDSLRSLANLIRAIVRAPNESSLFHFLPIWKIFPSSQLACMITMQLDSLDPVIRRRTVVDFWIPRLLQTPNADATVNVFEQMLDIASGLPLITHHVDYAVNEVDIQIPPNNAPGVRHYGARSTRTNFRVKNSSGRGGRGSVFVPCGSSKRREIPDNTPSRRLDDPTIKSETHSFNTFRSVRNPGYPNRGGTSDSWLRRKHRDEPD